MSQLYKAEITGYREQIPGICMIEFHAPDLAQAARPGQFIHICCSEGSDPLLRRPISIHAVDRQTGKLKILFQAVGKGTKLLAQHQKGTLDIIGPLGRGFTLDHVFSKKSTNNAADLEDIIVLGGGIGAAPLFFLLQEMAGLGVESNIKVLLGARNADQLLIKQEVEQLRFNVSVATDDGSVGYHGMVTELLTKEMPKKIKFVYACGPAPMLKMACNILNEYGVPGEVSIEERMACGVGACLSCACRVQDTAGREVYLRGCIDGPVFKAGEVVW